MSEITAKLLEYGYVLLFLYSIGGGMIALIAACVLSAKGMMDINLCMLLAFVANTLGSTLTYLLAKYYKKECMPYLKKHRRKLALVMLKMKKHAIFLIFSQKYIYGMKSFVPFVAGFTKIPFLSFFVINTLACLLWALSLGFASFYLANFISLIFEKITTFPLLAPTFLLLLVCSLLIYVNKYSKKNGL